MARLLVGFVAVCWLGCGSEGTLAVDGAAGTSAVEGGAAGAPTGAAGTGGGSGGVPEPAEGDISVADGDFNAGDPPPAEGQAGMPQIVNLTGPAAVTNGGSAMLRVEVSPPVASPSFVVSLAGQAGYHTVPGTDPDGDGIFDIAVQVAAEASQASLVLRVALVDAAGNVGAYREIEIALVQSGTGDVKITLSFDRLHDLDLRVTEPNGEEVTYDNPSTATGGELDLDSGINCMPSAATSENVFWPPGGAPAGEYIVRVHNYQQCTEGPIDYTVRVAYDASVNTYRGTFDTGTASEAVTAGSVKEVVRFRRGL